MTEYKKEEWILRNRGRDYAKTAQRFSVSEVLARIIQNREFECEEDIARYLNGGLKDTYDPALMKNMEQGCLLMREKIAQGVKIRIISDYDVDGITSNCILYEGLRGAGAEVSYDIPDRIRDGYGMNTRLVRKAYEDGVDTIITCDNGIAAFEAVALAKEYGMTVIVTDHHEVPCDIDESGKKAIHYIEADAVIDIKQEDCPYPYKYLCGAGVAYKFIRHLYRCMELPWEDEELYLDLVALGTVCDVMPLTDENRIFVKHGLQRLTHSYNVGMRALKKALGLEGKEIFAHHLSFRIGPCLNSTGRLESAKEGVELLLTKDAVRAEKLAGKMVALNEERKTITDKGVKDAMALVSGNKRIVPSADGLKTIDVGDDKVILLYLPDIHESVAGLVAGKIKEAFYRPTLVFTDAENRNGLKGSGRSIESYNMYEELSKHRDLFVHMGGHPMAAGFSITADKFELLRKALNESCNLTDEALTEKKYIDASIPLSMITEALYDELKRLEPYGTGNPTPLFGLLHMGISGVKMVGNEQQYARCTFKTRNGAKISGMVFNGKEFMDKIKEWFGTEECDKIQNGLQNNVEIDILYHPDKNEYNGRVTMQIQPVSFRKSESEPS